MKLLVKSSVTSSSTLELKGWGSSFAVLLFQRTDPTFKEREMIISQAFVNFFFLLTNLL